MRVNLDKLHDIALNYEESDESQKQGNTFYLCSLVVGAVGLDYSDVVVVTPDNSSRRYLEPMILRHLSMQGFCVSDVQAGSWILDDENNTKVIFRREDDLKGTSREDDTALVFVS